MIGRRVLVVTNDGSPASGHYDGVLQKQDATGVVVSPYGSLPEQARNVFVPMHRIKEILDKGRAP